MTHLDRRSLVLATAVSLSVIVSSGPKTHAQLTVKQVTSAPTNHRWPSINNRGDIVYSAQVGGAGPWRVILRPAGSNDDGMPVTNLTDPYDHKSPVIDDAGNIVYFKTGGSGGIGYQILRIDAASGTESVVEFSSRNIINGVRSERWAGRQAGISSDGKIVWYYDFFNPYPSSVRRFNISGVGRLGPDFIGSTHPDINSSLDFVYTATGGPTVIVKSNALNLQPRTITNGTKARINDEGDIVVMSGAISPFNSEDITDPGPMKLVLGSVEANTVRMGTGVWSDITNRSKALIVFEASDENGVRQIYTRRFLQGIDASQPLDWPTVVQSYDPTFVIADGWGGRSQFPAQQILSTAPTGLLRALYCLLNFDRPAQGGAYQVGQALAAAGNQAGLLKFLVIDVEFDGNLNTLLLDKPARVKRIAEAVQAVLDAGLQPIIYTNRGYWQRLVGSTTAFKDLALWDIRITSANAPPQAWDDDLATDFGNTWVPYGGWTQRAGRQYVQDLGAGAGGRVDLNVFDPRAFVGTYTRPPQAAELVTASWQPNPPPDSQVRVTGSALTFRILSRNPLRVVRSGSLTVTNVGDEPLAGPLQLLLTNLTPGYTLSNASGDRDGSPYLILPVEDAILQPGQSVTTEVNYEGTNTNVVDFVPCVYSGYW